MEVSRQSCVPAYCQIAEEIGRKIKSGELRPGDMIPSEAQLCLQYKVSRMTVRKGLALLAEAGYLETARGKGTFVARPRLERLAVDFALAGRFRSKLLAADITAAGELVAEKLEIAPNDRVICVRRVYSDEQGPVIYDRKFLPYTKGKPVLETVLRYAELPEMAERHADVLPVKSELTIGAKALETGEAEVLRESVGAPALVIEQTVFAAGERPIGWGMLVCSSRGFRLKAVSQPF